MQKKRKKQKKPKPGAIRVIRWTAFSTGRDCECTGPQKCPHELARDPEPDATQTPVEYELQLHRETAWLLSRAEPALRKLGEKRLAEDFQRRAKPSIERKQHVDAGQLGAAVRWRGNESVAEIIRELAKLVDPHGDPQPPADLWPLLYAAMDDLGLRPTERDGSYTHRLGEITYSTFRRAIQRARE